MAERSCHCARQLQIEQNRRDERIGGKQLA
jgi:hypothetical protein